MKGKLEKLHKNGQCYFTRACLTPKMSYLIYSQSFE